MAGTVRQLIIWILLAALFSLPIIAAAMSPLLQWREPIYIIAGFAGVASMTLLLIQPLLAGGYLPGFTLVKSRRIHRSLGAVLVLLVIVHVGALWITSPPDVIDALLFVSPTPFSPWGVIAMWAVLATGFLALIRKKIRLRLWRMVHKSLAIIIVTSTIVHAYLIDGTMENITKITLSAAIAIVSLKLILDRK